MSGRLNVRTVGVVGRFQPFHWGHFEYLTEAALLGDVLVVGIANPTAAKRRHTSADVERSADISNPFSFDQRRRMIQGSLRRTSPHLRIDVRPCDLTTTKNVWRSLGSCDLVALTIYDAWGAEKSKILEDAGYEVIVLWKRSEKLTTGHEIRRRINMNAPWDHLVPPGTAQVIRRDMGK
jgi:cytidyltransferase-like protein